MKRPTMLLVKAVLKQLALDLDLSVERDIQRIVCRFEHEGLSFLTITLPKLSDALERGIESGSFTCPSEFAKHGRLPRFLGGFFKRVFDKDGELQKDACPYTIAGIRQVCRFFKKLKLGCTASREASAAQHFLDVEGELRRATPQIERKDIVLEQVSRVLWAQVFPELDYTRLVCHHGPGSTADRYRSNERYEIRKWNERSEYSYPSDLHCYPNYGAAAECSEGGAEGERGPKFLSLRDEESVRIVFVPKTQSAPRVIAIEPSHVMYMQQSLKDYMYKTLEEHSLTRNSVRFSDQTVNQKRAYTSSIDKRLATLDLKDASDRVHLHLVQRIFKTSGLLEYLEDARSLHATLPDGRNIVLTKYASQGSALCFPVEACVFYTLVLTVMHMVDSVRPSSRSIKKYSRSIDIYGDDIIVPVNYADAVVRYLESYALKVNVGKSFRNSLFRESCGADYYNGVAVNPVYARTVPPDNVRNWQAEEIMSWNATADLFYMRGQWHIAQEIRNLLRSVVRHTIPRSRVPGPGLYHFSLLFTTNLHWNVELQCFKQKRLQYHPLKRRDSIDGNERASLLKWGISSSLRENRDNQKDDCERWATTYCGKPFNAADYLMAIRDNLCQNEQTRSLGDLPKCTQDLQEIPEVLQWERINSYLAGEVSGSLGRLPRVHSGRGVLSVQTSGLDIKPEALDFSTSVKRGSFKSKCRWVSLHS